VRLVIVGNKVGKSELKQIAWLDVHENGDLFVGAIDDAVQDGVLALTNDQLANGGFFVQVGKVDPDDESRYITYTYSRSATQTYFDLALKATVAMLWTGKQVGSYEINGFASFIAPGA
jgi:hypothetical protein